MLGHQKYFHFERLNVSLVFFFFKFCCCFSCFISFESVKSARLYSSIFFFSSFVHFIWYCLIFSYSMLPIPMASKYKRLSVNYMYLWLIFNLMIQPSLLYFIGLIDLDTFCFDVYLPYIIWFLTWCYIGIHWIAAVY